MLEKAVTLPQEKEFAEQSIQSTTLPSTVGRVEINSGVAGRNFSREQTHWTGLPAHQIAAARRAERRRPVP